MIGRMPIAPQPSSPFEHAAFRRYWSAALLAGLGLQIQVVAVGWQMYELTGSALNLGLVGLVQFAPSALLIFVTGALVDRVARKPILITARVIETLAALALAAASASGHATPAALYGLVLVIGTTRAFSMPAGQALLSALVPESALPRAVALNSSAHQGAAIAGPVLGGLLSIAGAQWAYACSAVLMLSAALLLSTVKPLRHQDQARTPIDLAYLLGGIRFIRGHRVLLGAVLLDLFAVLLGGATALLPIYARDVLGTDAWGLGVLRAAPGAGALAMALWLGRHALRRRVGATMLISVAVFGAATMVFGLSRWLPLSVFALALAGAADMISVVVRQSLMQLETPDAMRGRVGAVTSVFIGASNQIGEFESGLLAAWLGAVPAVVLGGVGTMLIVLAWWRWFPELARRQRL